MKYVQGLFKKCIIIIFFFASLTILSCQKDKVEETPEPTKKELLSKEWKVSDLLANGVSVIDLNLPIVQCMKDNSYTLISDNTYAIGEGAIVCDPSTAGTGTWALIENDTKIHFIPEDGDELIFTIAALDTTTLKFTYVDGEGGGAVTYTIVLVKK